MRFIVYGAGAIGGCVGACLIEHAHDVVLIARGEHRRVMAQVGLTFSTPGGVRLLPVNVVATPEDIAWRSDDVVLMTMKTQDSIDALRALSLTAPAETLLVCMQNGVESERLALRFFANVYGCMVLSPTMYLSPGSVVARAAPNIGVYDLGKYPSGVDDTAEEIASVLNESAMSSTARPDILDWKYAKLLTNLGNAVQAIFDTDRRSGGPILEGAAAEARACFAAAGISYINGDKFRERSALANMELQPVAGVDERHVGSTWQSLARGVGSIESDYLNGEIVMLGRLHGIPTPINQLLQRISDRLAARGGKPGEISEDQFLHMLATGKES